MNERAAFTMTAFARDLCLFLCAVVMGTIAGVSSQQLLLHVVSPSVAAHVSLALATTCTGVAHSRLVHRRPMGYLLPSLVAGAPVAYGAMQLIHFVTGV